MKKLKSLIISELLINNIFNNDDYNLQMNVKNLNVITFNCIERFENLKNIISILKQFFKFKIVKFKNENSLYSITLKFN